VLFPVSKTSKAMNEQNPAFTEKAAAAEPYSILRAIKQKLKGQEPVGIYKEMNERGKAEWPSPAGTNPDAIYVPAQNLERGFIPNLLGASVLTNVGATLKAGLTPNIPVPTSGWGANEEDPNTIDALKKLHPRRLFSQNYISGELFDREVFDSEQILRYELAKSLALSVDGAVLGNAQASDTQTGGLFHGVTNVVEMSWPEIFKLGKAMDAVNAQGKKGSYILGSYIYGIAKESTSQATLHVSLSSEMGIDANRHRYIRSYSVYSEVINGKYGIIFGTFEDMFIGQWGSFEIVSETLPSGYVCINVHSYWDAVLRKDSVMSATLFTIPPRRP
jgi:hypothetical protein